MSIKNFLFGTPGKFERLPGVPENALGDVSKFYQSLMSGEGFQDIAQPELRRFNQETIPDIAEQFAGLGSGGGLSSSGFQNSAATAATDLGERLASLRARLRMQGAENLQNLSQQNTFYREGQPGALNSILGGLGTAAGVALGGPIGASLGGLAGNNVGKWFSSLQNQSSQNQPSTYKNNPFNPSYNNPEQRMFELRSRY